MTSGNNAPLVVPAWFDTFDQQVDDAWERFRGKPALDAVFYAASAAADFSAIWHGINTVRTLRRGEVRADAVRVAVALAVESVAVNQGIKRLFQRERPVAEGRPHHLRQPSTSSFPSGHASAATVAAMVMNTRGPARAALGLAAGVVGTSRLHVRIHHASDVLAGAAVGWIFGRATRKLWPL